MDHDDDGSITKNEDNDKKNDDEKGGQCVMPNPHTLNDERSRQGLSMRPGRARDEQKK